MSGRKRKYEREGLGHSVLGEVRNLSNLSQAASKRSKSGLADHETNGLIDNESLLVENLEAAGFFLKKKDKENILIEDQAIFLKKLKDDIVHNYDYPDNITKMLKTLTLWLEKDEVFLVKCLRPTKTGSLCSTARSAMQVRFDFFLPRPLIIINYDRIPNYRVNFLPFNPFFLV